MSVGGFDGVRDPVLRVEAITKSFGSTRALQGVDFDVQPGEVHALVGENGAGKSTLLRIVSGLETPSSGTIVVRGKTYAGLTPSLAQEAGIALVPQSVELVEHLSVADNLFLNRWPRRGALVDQRRMIEEGEQLLEGVGLQNLAKRRVADLSYVQKQMVEVARLSEWFSPSVIILDEPTAALSVREIEVLFRLVLHLRSIGVAVIYVTHHLGELRRIADRVTVLRDGNVTASGIPADAQLETIMHHMVGDFPDLYSRRQSRVGGTVLSLENAGTRDTDDLTFEVREGEIVGIAAPKGEGVSDLLRALCAISDSKVKGGVLYKGEPLRVGSASEALSQGIGYLSEDRARWGVIRARSIRENLTLSSLEECIAASGLISRRRERELALGMAGRFWVKMRELEDPIESLSGGNQQKVLIGRILSTEASLYMLDDPTFGVDVNSKAEINRILNVAVSSGAAIVLHTGDTQELVEMSDRIVVIKQGRVNKTFMKGEVSVAQLETELE